MSDRSERVGRRAALRVHTRAVLDAVDPEVGGGAAHHRCIAPGCDRRGPSVNVGEVRITFCPAHKAMFDRRWRRGAQPATGVG